MPPRICTCCHPPHVTSDWYVITESKHPQKGQVECRQAHEDRVRREVRETIRRSPKEEALPQHPLHSY